MPINIAEGYTSKLYIFLQKFKFIIYVVKNQTKLIEYFVSKAQICDSSHFAYNIRHHTHHCMTRDS